LTGDIMRKFFAICALFLMIAAGAFALDFGIGYVQSANMNALTFTVDPIPLITVQSSISLFNAGLSPVLSMKGWSSPDPEPSNWDYVSSDHSKFGASINAGSIGARCLFNLQRPTPNTKFYTGLGINIMFLTLGITDTIIGTPNTVIEVNGSGWAVDLMPVAGFEYRPKEIKNLGLYAEIGYDMTIAGNIDGSYSASNGSNYEKGKLLLQPNGFLGRTFWGIGATWYF
jgi:hypothetical protein